MFNKVAEKRTSELKIIQYEEPKEKRMNKNE